MRERKAAAELAPADVRIAYWARELVNLCREHERLAKSFNAVPWFITPVTPTVDELDCALKDAFADQQTGEG